jgi:hypothetical protein
MLALSSSAAHPANTATMLSDAVDLKDNIFMMARIILKTHDAGQNCVYAKDKHVDNQDEEQTCDCVSKRSGNRPWFAIDHDTAIMKNAAKIIPSVIQYKTDFPLFALSCVILISCRSTSLCTTYSAQSKEHYEKPTRAPFPAPA